MKAILAAGIVSIGLIAAPGAALAQEDLAKSSGCLNCHAVDTKKAGPAFKDVAAKYKGKADAAATLETALTSGKGHPPVKASPENVKSLVKWILSM